MPRDVLIQFRAGAAATWASVNPVLILAEAGYETDTKKLKIGDGTTAWNALAYFSSDVADNSVTNAKLADMAQATLKGRAAGAGTGDPVDLSPTQVRTALGAGTWTAQQTFNSVAQVGTIAARFENTAANIPTGATGQGLEIFGSSAGVGVVQSYNRTTNALGPLGLSCSQLQIGGPTYTAGAVAVTGYIPVVINGTTYKLLLGT